MTAHLHEHGRQLRLRHLEHVRSHRFDPQGKQHDARRLFHFLAAAGLWPTADVHGNRKRRDRIHRNAHRHCHFLRRHHFPGRRHQHYGWWEPRIDADNISTLSVGPHSITAAYSGDCDFLTGTTAAATNVTVGKSSTTTTVTSSSTNNTSMQGTVGDVHGHDQGSVHRRGPTQRNGNVLRRNYGVVRTPLPAAW